MQPIDHTTLVALYRSARRPSTGIGVTGKGYYRYYYQPTASQALASARHELAARPLRALWDRLESSHLVRLRFEPECESYSVNDIVGDCDHPRCCNGRAHWASNGKRPTCDCRKPTYCKLCQSAIDAVERDGLNTAFAEYKVSPCDCGPARDACNCRSDDWKRADSIGMIVGTDLDSDYADGMKRECIDQLRKALRSRVRITASHTAGLVKGGAV